METPGADLLLARIEGEYREMPGLKLTVAQARRLWGIEPRQCQTLLTTLVDRRVLAVTRDGAFVRCVAGPGVSARVA
ncbi:MAG TPA: hypothetical protein VFX12_00820 [Vicinamibacterales bacterium]|nr:hypothetical protein [Vicinamibacterales bacterium]